MELVFLLTRSIIIYGYFIRFHFNNETLTAATISFTNQTLTLPSAESAKVSTAVRGVPYSCQNVHLSKHSYLTTVAI